VALSTDIGFGVQSTSPDLNRGEVSPGHATSLDLNLAVDWFFVRQVSLGAFAGYSSMHPLDGPTTHDADAGIRLGVAFPIADHFSGWLRYGVYYQNIWDDAFVSSAVTMSVSLPLLYHPTPGLFVGFGPEVAVDFSRRGMPDEQTEIGAALTIGIGTNGVPAVDQSKALSSAEEDIGKAHSSTSPEQPTLVVFDASADPPKTDRTAVAANWKKNPPSKDAACAIAFSDDRRTAWYHRKVQGPDGYESGVVGFDPSLDQYTLRSYQFGLATPAPSAAITTAASTGSNLEKGVLADVLSAMKAPPRTSMDQVDTILAKSNTQQAKLLRVWINWAMVAPPADAQAVPLHNRPQEIAELLEDPANASPSVFAEDLEFAQTFLMIDRALRSGKKLTDEEQKRYQGTVDATPTSTKSLALEGYYDLLTPPSTLAVSRADDIMSQAASPLQPVLVYIASRIYDKKGPPCVDVYKARALIHAAASKSPVAWIVAARIARDELVPKLNTCPSSP
jgi:hypothetical protein